MSPPSETHMAINRRIDEVDTKATLALTTAEQVRNIVETNTESINSMRKENTQQHNKVTGRVDSVYNLLVGQHTHSSRLKLAKRHWLITTIIGVSIFLITSFVL